MDFRKIDYCRAITTLVILGYIEQLGMVINSKEIWIQFCRNSEEDTRLGK